MANQIGKYEKYLNEWEPQFQKRTVNFTNGPLEKRKCQDICCLVSFIVLFAAFVGISAYCTDSAFRAINSDVTPDSEDDYFGDADQLRNFILAVVGMSMLSLVMCVLFVLLTKAYPKCMVYAVITFISGLFVVGALALFFVGAVFPAFMVLITLLIYLAILFCCFKKHLKTAIVLVKVTGTFLTERPIVYVVPLIMSVISMLFTGMWVGSILGLAVMGSTNPPPIDGGVALGFIFIEIFGYIFFTFFSYYVMVFVVASCVAIWYYQSRRSMIGSGLKWLFQGHIGSITFASMVITIIKMMQLMVSNKKSNNVASEIARQICLCLLKELERFVKVMNRFAVIIMSFTGEDFVTSCKSTGVIIFKNLGVFSVITIVSNFFYYSGILICAGVPTAIAGIILSNVDIKDPTTPILLVFFSSMLISNTFLATFTETLTSVFVFYSLDLQLQEYGINIVNIPSDMQLLLEHAFDDSEDFRESFLDKAKKERDVVHTGDHSHEDIRQNQYVPPPPQPNYYGQPPQYPPAAYGAPPPGYAYPPPPPGYAAQPQGYPAPPPQGYPQYPPQGYPNQPYYQPPPPNQ